MQIWRGRSSQPMRSTLCPVPRLRRAPPPSRSMPKAASACRWLGTRPMSPKPSAPKAPRYTLACPTIFWMSATRISSPQGAPRSPPAACSWLSAISIFRVNAASWRCCAPKGSRSRASPCRAKPPEMTRNSNPIETLIDLMARLPGLGPRSARRAVLYLIRKRAVLLAPLADAMAEVARTARECLNCGNVGTSDICEICNDESRANGLICVVEEVADLWAMERGRVFRGRYHVLGGTLSALDGIGPEQLRIPQLLRRIEAENVTEVILALNATIDGQTTAHYIADQLDGRTALSSLAQGVP